ncbi:sigma-54-dependent transcriptional regulator [Geomesophilobacter sediminis]|uniref:DNA-binding transcriptional regulator NtrC n=1 Tax=Geomesophilobacter sediminis TaxID=2798584 RepID=A0A8J7M2D5_9BACT|nr:sigma-54 dependent transcriptional regulator [Geomesophilobacter sediminis]MBJ6727126.1 sigma-54-dependent Fis family transcriptional regulator [Geomesophilobacter sediminis]
MQKPTVLVCDDEVEILRYLKKILTAGGVEAGIFSSGKALLDHLENVKQAPCNLVLLDVKMPDVDGIEVLQRIKVIHPDLPVVIMTAFGSIGSAVDAMKLGAYDYVAKPFPKEKVLGLLEKVLERERLLNENNALKEELGRRPADTIIYSGDSFREVIDLAHRVAASEANALIVGESGTGKELIARLIHDSSPRKNQHFVSINCAALPDTLLESQLFGHVRGAFTGAITNHKGLLEEADGGTLFLDEIGDMSRAIQAKVLRVIQERDFIPVGGTKPKTVDIRFVAATNKDLEAEARQGNFREDLYFRLNVITLKLPPLRERREDIPPLARHFLAKFARRMNRELLDFSDEALRLMQSYNWPGNVRELQNAVERATILAKGNLVTPDVLPGWKKQSVEEAPAHDRLVPLATVERDHIRYILKQTGNNKSRAAQILGIARRTLDRKIEEYELETGTTVPREVY